MGTGIGNINISKIDKGMCFVVELTVVAASIAPAVAPANSEILGLIF